MKVILQFSGGKDSQASLILAVEKYGAENIEAVFMDTKWEKVTLYPHIRKFCKDIGVKLTELTSLKYDGMIGLVEKKKRFPSSQARFCTEELKVKPFINYLLDEVKDHVIILQGIRADESEARSEMDEQCTFFKYYFQPHTNNFIKLQKVNKFIKKLRYKNKKVPVNKFKEQETLTDKLINGVLDNKFYSYRKKDVNKHVDVYCADVIRNVFDKTGQEVIDIILDAGYIPFENYYEGYSRVGCYPCINENLFGIYQMSVRDPKRIDEIELEEIRLGTSFFTTGKIPKRECANGQYPTIREVVNYTHKLYAMNKLFKEQNDVGCLSHFMLCKS